MRAIAPWFGSKRKLAPRIIQAMGKHNVYWEPFCGSLAVLLAKDPCTMETANDLHGDLINLARVLQRESEALDLYGRLSRALMHEDLYRENAALLVQQEWPEIPSVDRAAAFMICCWMGRNGTAGTAGHLRGLQSQRGGFCVRYTANGGHAAKRWESVVASIPDWHARLRNVTMLRRDAFDLLPKIDDAAGTAIYVDPPYLIKGDKYVYDFSNGQHEHLASELSRFRRARVVVSYYNDQALESLYPEWARIDCSMTKSLGNQVQRDSQGSAIAQEVLLVNDRRNVGRLF